MRKTLISAFVATALALTSAPQPVQAAEGDDLARILGAAATLFIVGKAIEQSKDRKKKQKAQKKAKAPKVAHATPLPRVIGPRGGHAQHPGYTRRRPPPLPQQCLLPVSGAKTRYVMGERCLSRNYASARPLPSACQMNVQTRRGIRPAYSVRCLRRQGYDIAGR